MTERITEGAEYFTVYTTTKESAEKWAKRFKKTKHIISVSVTPYKGGDIDFLSDKEIPPTFNFKVTARKDGWWFSDEFPFRAGVRILFRK